MTVYNESTMETLYSNDEPSRKCSCKVVMTDDILNIVYEDDNSELISYLGKSNGVGHYELVCESLQGKATLHGFEGGVKLDGYWVEGQEQGMCRIHLKA